MENYTKNLVDMYGNIYYFNSQGQYHCLDGPDVTFINASKEWYINGKCHRLDGPAIVWGGGHREWWINNVNYSKSCHNRLYLFSTLEPQRIDLNPTED
jgi:hypothetical protein